MPANPTPPVNPDGSANPGPLKPLGNPPPVPCAQENEDDEEEE